MHGGPETDIDPYSGGHGFDSCRGLRNFLCPMLVSCLNNSPLQILHCFTDCVSCVLFIFLSAS